VQVGQPSSSEASQQELLEVLPPILVLHLKRFLYDSAANEINKISKTVQFAPELEIPPGMLLNTPLLPKAKIPSCPEIMTTVSEKPAEPVHYMLYGVLYAYGKSASNVHYTVDVLNGESGGEAWLHIDDEVVSTVRHEDVFGWNDNEPGDERCAYMLFYCRTASART
jgi:ubiquitin carboxyl-terminal hydrolase 10